MESESGQLPAQGLPQCSVASRTAADACPSCGAAYRRRAADSGAGGWRPRSSRQPSQSATSESRSSSSDDNPEGITDRRGRRSRAGRLGGRVGGPRSARLPPTSASEGTGAWPRPAPITRSRTSRDSVGSSAFTTTSWSARPRSAPESEQAPPAVPLSPAAGRSRERLPRRAGRVPLPRRLTSGCRIRIPIPRRGTMSRSHDPHPRSSSRWLRS